MDQVRWVKGLNIGIDYQHNIFFSFLTGAMEDILEKGECEANTWETSREILERFFGYI